jgi:hypothetical protein
MVVMAVWVMTVQVQSDAADYANYKLQRQLGLISDH